MSTPGDPLDDGRATKFVAELWQKLGMPSLGPHSSALSMLLVYLLKRDPDRPAMTLAYEFGDGGELRDYTLRGEDGRLLCCTAFRPDGTKIEEQQLEECGD
jgi:hypothetical protein